MNASRLLELVQLIHTAEKATNTQKALAKVKEELDNLVSQPAQPTYQSEFVAALGQLEQALSLAASHFQPAQVNLLEEIGAARFFSTEVVREINRWLADNPATPAVAQQQLREFQEARDEYLTRAEQLRKNLVEFNVKVNALAEGQAEVGFLVPRDLFENELEPMLKELGVIKNIIRAFSEAAIGKPEPIEVRQISTSDPLFFFGLSPETIALIGAATTWALHTWKQVEEIRKIRAETAKIASFKDDPIEELFEAKIKKHVEAAVRQQTKEIVKAIKGDRGRRNEQEVHIKWALESLVARVERGMTVEIRLIPPKPPQEDGDPAGAQPERPVFEQLSQISQQLRFPKMEGTPVLQIPPPEPAAKP